MPKRSRKGVASSPARVVAPTRVKGGRSIRTVRAAGMNEAKVATDLNSKAIEAEIQKNLELGRALGLTGTPSYVVGNKILSGAVGYEALKEAVEAARAAVAAASRIAA